MINKKKKLELTWIGKDEELKLEPRILIEDPYKSYGNSKSENMLIYGDNLLALKALHHDYAGKIKCIYIDPPYNTGNAFEHYDDGLEHSIWLSLMKPRLELLKELLRDDGVIFVQIDDNEQAYLRVLMDEIYGRENFLNNITWKRKGGKTSPDARKLENSIDFLLMFQKSKNFNIKFLFTKANSEKYIETQFKYTDEKGRRYRISPLNAPQPRPTLQYDFMGYKPHPNGWSVKKETLQKFYDDGKLVFPKNIDGRVNRKQYLDEWEGYAINSLWDDIGLIAASSSERMNFDRNQKPERLIERVIELSTEPGDIVLDSFLGSGTTAAVAHKMNRKWIGIELGDHANTHCLPRLKAVVDGSDQSGISKSIKWMGGGGFKFYNLAPSLLRKDSFGNFVIDEKYNANMLAAAMCKHEGFKYSPDEAIYWKQGKSTETDHIFVTTGFVTVEQLDAIHAQMTENESLLICAKSFAPECENQYSNITIKKIPQMILGKCEFGKNNYDLNIIKAVEVEAEKSEEVSDEH